MARALCWRSVVAVPGITALIAVGLSFVMIVSWLGRTPAVIGVGGLCPTVRLPQFPLLRGCIGSLRGVPTAATATAPPPTTATRAPGARPVYGRLAWWA